MNSTPGGIMSRQEIYDQITEAFGFVPGFYETASDAALQEMWGGLGWLQSDTALTGLQKILVAFGAAAAAHCEYWGPFHTAQLALYGLGDEQIEEASWAARFTTGISTYLYGIGYDKQKFLEDLERIVQYIKESARE
jgi:AhpD family alkylhydroperoxidase